MIVVITAKSASGKTMLSNYLLNVLLNAGVIQSTTTRGRRPDDSDHEYRFISFIRFCWELLTGQYVSWRKGSWKMTTRDLYSVRLDKIREALASSRVFVRSLTPDTIPKWYKVGGEKMVFIHLIGPDEHEARRRMRQRGGMTDEQIERRISDEVNWDEEIQTLRSQGIPIHVIPELSLEEVYQKALSIVESYR